MSVSMSYDTASKKLLLDPQLEQSLPQLKLEIDQLNILTSEVIGCGADVPTPPTPQTFNQETAKMVKKLYDGGVQSFKVGKYHDAVKQFSIGIDMISRRYKFESFQYTLQELGLFLMSRADAYLKTGEYLKSYNDSDMLLGMMLCTPENFLRRGVANYFLGNYELARGDYQRGLAFDENNQRLLTELEICLDKILEENGDYL
jgi:translocation protein SEC72